MTSKDALKKALPSLKAMKYALSGMDPELDQLLTDAYYRMQSIVTNDNIYVNK